MVRFSFFSICFMRPIAAVYLAAVSLCTSSLLVLLCSASITCTSQRSGLTQGWSHPAPRPPPHPLGGVVQHLLPGCIKLPVVLLQESLLGQRDGLLGGSQHLCGSLEVLGGPLGLQLGLKTTGTHQYPSVSQRRSAWGGNVTGENRSF